MIDRLVVAYFSIAISIYIEQEFRCGSRRVVLVRRIHKTKFCWHFILHMKRNSAATCRYFCRTCRCRDKFFSYNWNRMSQQRAEDNIKSIQHNTMDIASRTSTPLPSPSITQRKRADSCAAVDETLGPITTSVSGTDPSHTIRRSQTVYSPLVSSMVQSNTLRDCHQIQSMLTQCQLDSAAYSSRTTTNRNGDSSSSEPFVCRTAKKYHAMCLSGERL